MKISGEEAVNILFSTNKKIKKIGPSGAKLHAYTENARSKKQKWSCKTIAVIMGKASWCKIMLNKSWRLISNATLIRVLSIINANFIGVSVLSVKRSMVHRAYSAQ